MMSYVQLKNSERRNRFLLNVFIAVLMTLLSATFSPCTRDGLAEERPTVEEIRMGMSTALTGPTAELGKNMHTGVLAGLERINRAGGIRNRKLRLITLDDGYEPGRAAFNMRRLIEEEQALAVIGNVGTPTAISAIPIANEQKTLFFAPFTGAGVLRRSPPDRYVINYRSSYAEEVAAMVDALIDIGGLKPAEIAFFTQRDGYGDAGYAGGTRALKRHGPKDEKTLLHFRYERNTLAVENALADILLNEPLPRAVVMVGTYAPCAKFIKLAKASNLNAVFLNVSFVGSTMLARELGKEIDGVIVTQVVPHFLNTELPIVQDYHTDLKAWNTNATPTFVSLEGYIAARILGAALQTIEGEPTREAIVNALEGLGTFDLGLGKPLHISPKKHQASQYVWPTILVNGHFVPFNWAEIATILNEAISP
jgi:ABC-type branched-subunit amino acid transport system substrate-binding protein